MNIQKSGIKYKFFILVILVFNSCHTEIKDKKEKEHKNETKNNKTEYIKHSIPDEEIRFANQLNIEILKYIQTRITFDSIDAKNYTFVLEFAEDHYTKPNKNIDTILKISTYNCDIPYEGYRGVLKDQEYVVALFDKNGFSNHLIKDSMLIFKPLEELICNEEFLILTYTYVIYNKKLFKWDPGKPKPYIVL